MTEEKNQEQVNSEMITDGTNQEVDQNSEEISETQNENTQNIEEEIQEDDTEYITVSDDSEEKVDEGDEEVHSLYDEFSTYLKQTDSSLTEGVGTKIVIPTGIDLIDAILGGGFAVGCLNIIVGQPGGGKCLDYNEEIDVYIDEDDDYNMLVKKRMKIGELFEKYAEDEKINEISSTKKDIYIESESGNLVKLNGVIKKDKSKIFLIELDDETKLKAADKHQLKIEDDLFKYVDELNIGDYVKTKHGKKQIINKVEVDYNYVYDVSMQEEHVYTTPNGMIHHNTMLACQTLGNGQQLYNGKILGSVLDAEESMTTSRLYNLGVRKPKIKPYSDITIEKVFKFLEGICMFKREKGMKDVPSVVIWDSIANTLSEKERETEDVNSVIGQKARILSLSVPKYVSKCSEHNVCWIAINQLREKLQMGPFQEQPDLKFMGQNKDMPGGQAPKFNAFQMLSVNIKSAIDTSKSETKYPFDGMICKIKCIKNKLFTPNIEIEALADFYHGFSNFWTNYNFLVKTKRLQAGAWNYLIDYPNMKFRTKNAYQYYQEDENFRQAFDSVAQDAIQKEIVDKYQV